MKRFSTILGLAAVILLIGSGCAGSEAPADLPEADDVQPAAADARPSPRAKNTDEAGDTMKAPEAAGFTLSAHATGDRSAMFEWTVPEDIADQAEKYVVVRGTEANPEHPASWWWWRGPVYRDLEWKELPLGEAHFRVCAQVEEACIAYSNDVVLEIE